MRDGVNGPSSSRGGGFSDDRRRSASAPPWEPATDPAIADPSICESLRRDLDLWLEGELADPPRALIVRAHLRSCAACAEHAREYDELTREILASEAGACEDRSPAGAAADRILVEIARESRRGALPRALSPRGGGASDRSRRGLPIAIRRLAAAAALVLAGFWTALALIGLDRDRPGSGLRSPGDATASASRSGLVLSDEDAFAPSRDSVGDRLRWLLEDRIAHAGGAAPGRLQLYGIRSSHDGRTGTDAGPRPAVEWVVDAAWTPWAARRPGLRFFLVRDDLGGEEPIDSSRPDDGPRRSAPGGSAAGVPEIIPVSWFTPDRDAAPAVLVAEDGRSLRFYRVWVVNELLLPHSGVPGNASDPGEVLRGLRRDSAERWPLEPGLLR